MRFSKSLVRVLVISLLGECIFYWLTCLMIDKYAAPILATFGWMFWMGLLSFFIPLFVRKETAFGWFQEKYAWASIILFALHVFCLIVVGVFVIDIFYGN